LSDFFDGTGRLRDPVIFGSPGQVADPTHPANVVPSGSYVGVPGPVAPGGFQPVTHVLTQPPGAPIRNQRGFAPIGVQQNHNNLINTLANFSSTFATTAAGSPALTVGIQFLDDIQVDLLIEATQADRRAVVLTAPRLTFFNGQRAWVAVTTQQAFVASLTPITGDSAGAFAPNVGVVADGFVLDVEGVISADRRYVTMTVIFDFAELLGFTTATFTGATGGGGFGGAGATFAGSISLPTLRASQVRTTVSVPDKGTVLLGGQRHVEEIEVEVGVPVLSKIPFINRFFTNRATEKNEQTLLILIRPEIIIQQENEDLLFPGLTDSLSGGAGYLR
jgi:type II secretory pathway component GspD/PulD (secretin)